MKKLIEDYLLSNNYRGEGLADHLNANNHEAEWLASTTPSTSGIILVDNIRYYFYCIKPWAFCPTGQLTVMEY